MQSNELIFTPTKELICPKCGKKRKESGKIHKDGLCVPCRNLRIREYHREHKDRFNKLRRERYANGGRAKVRARNNAWKHAHKEQAKESNNRWRKENPEKGRKWERENPIAMRTIKDRSHLKRKYGLSLEQWNAMYVAQSGKCKICGDVFGTRKPHTGHDHNTGRVRDLLCSWCNHVVGVIEGDAELFERAQQYVARWKEVPHEPSNTTK